MLLRSCTKMRAPRVWHKHRRTTVHTQLSCPTIRVPQCRSCCLSAGGRPPHLHHATNQTTPPSFYQHDGLRKSLSQHHGIACQASASPRQHTQPLARLALVSGINTASKTDFFNRLVQCEHIGLLLGHSLAAVRPSGPVQPVELSNGSFIGDASDPAHVQQMQSLMAAGQLKCGLLEDSPSGSPLLTAAAFDLEHPAFSHTDSPNAPASPECLITVVHAPSFVQDALSSTSLQETGLSDEPASAGVADEGTHQEEAHFEDDEALGTDDRTVADVLVDQVEYSQVLVVHGLSALDVNESHQLLTLLRHLNRQAQIVDLDSTVSAQQLADLCLRHPSLDLGALQQNTPGWAVELSNWDQPAADAAQTLSSPGHSSSCAVTGGDAALRHSSGQGVSTWRYSASRPFHPQRLLDKALSGTWPGVVRSKGYVWLATRNDYIGMWQSAGGSWQCEPRSAACCCNAERVRSGLWAAGVPEAERPQDLDTSQWHPQWGDRCTQLVWTGVDMQENVLREMLDSCLLTDEELAAGPDTWATYDDPLPEWQHEDHDHEHDDSDCDQEHAH